MHFGQSVHRAFESIDWYQPDLKFEKLLDQKCDASLVQTLKNCFNSESFQQLFKQFDRAVTLWKEKAFTLCEKQSLIYGIFDRVHLFKSPEGAFLKAQIIDFKTDAFSDKYCFEEAIERQKLKWSTINLALAKLISIDRSQIECYLVFTSIARVHRLN